MSLPAPTLTRTLHGTSHEPRAAPVGADASGAGAVDSLEGAKRQLPVAKIVLLGETATGKTSLAVRFVNDTFVDWSESTIGAAFLTKTMIRAGKPLLRLDLWDTAGQERYRSLAPMYYRSAKAAIVCYDVTSRASFEHVKIWVAELERDGPTGIVLAIVGNKSDLSMYREVHEEDGRAYAASVGAVFQETSAKKNESVAELFETVVDRIDAVFHVTAEPALSPASRGRGAKAIRLESNQSEYNRAGAPSESETGCAC